MCGIGGIYVFDNQYVSPYVLQELIIALLDLLEERGRDATGIAIYYNDATMYIRKAPIRAERFIELLPFSRLKLDRAKIVLLHCRAATQGDPEDNENNHPLYAFAWKRRRVVSVVHNGVIRTYGSSWVTDFVEREVDSDMLLAGVRRWGELTVKVINDTIDEVYGSMACLWTDGSVLVSYRYNNPLYIWWLFHNNDPKMVVYASTEEILATALSCAGIGFGKGDIVEVAENRILVHTANGGILSVEGPKNYVVHTYGYYYNRRDKYKNSYFNHNGYFGWDPYD